MPGNHDEFLVGYALGISKYVANLTRNGGLKTMEELDELRYSDWSRFSDLMNWLAELPIQRVHKYNSNTYVLAHALFNQKLYEYNPDYCLYNYFKDSNVSMSRRVYNTLWFRKNKVGEYIPSEMPDCNSIMVIGHTPSHYVDGSLDLADRNGNVIKVYCVDGGIAYGNEMLKYDGGDKTVGTFKGFHVDTSPKTSEMFIDIDKEREELFQYYILGTSLKRYEVSNRALDNYVLESANEVYDISKYYLAKGIFKGSQSYIDIVDNYISTVDFENNTDISSCDSNQLFYLKYYDYVRNTFFNYMIENLLDRYNNDAKAVAVVIDSFLYGDSKPPEYKGDLACFPNYKNTLNVALLLGSDSMNRIFKLHGCSSTYEYIKYKYTKISGYGMVRKPQ